MPSREYQTLPWDSDVAAEMELEALSKMKHPVLFVDSYHQCWATSNSNGRHYIPLLPNIIASFGNTVAECLGQDMIVDR